MGTDELVKIADDLYALPAEEFTKARDAAAKDAKGDPDCAAALKALKRPTASAWLVNQVTRQRADRLAELLALGDELRAAQDALAGDELRRLNRERHQLIRAVVDEARTLAPKVTDQVTREVEATLDAALADPAAGDAIRTGRLLRALASAGFDGVDLTDAVAVPDAKPAARRKTPPRTKAQVKPEKPAPDKRELAQARREVERLADKLGQSDAELAAARERVDAARAELDRLETELVDARAERTAAEKQIEKAQRDRNAVARDHRAAEQRLGKLS